MRLERKMNLTEATIKALETKLVEDSQVGFESEDAKDRYERMMNTLYGYENFIITYDTTDDYYAILGNDIDGQLYAIEFDKDNWGRVTKIYTVAENIPLSKAFIDLTNNLASDFKDIVK